VVRFPGRLVEVIVILLAFGSAPTGDNLFRRRLKVV